MHSKLASLLAATIFISTTSAAADCNTFLTNGSTAATFQYHRFYDFRNLHGSAGVDAASAPSGKDGYSVSSSSNGQSKIVAAAPWDSGWDARNWFRPAPKEDTVDMQYTPSRVAITNDSASTQDPTYLTLHTTRLPNGTQLAAELDFTEYNVTYASIRMSARIHGASGAIAGFFTYHNDTAESDIEIPTGGSSNELHCSNQPTTDPDTDVPIQGATYNVSMADHLPTSTWNNYRLDWVPGRSAWYVNGAQSADTGVNVPADAESKVILNLWSNGGNFSGRMNEGEEAWFDIQWVQLLFNTTGSSNTQSKGTVCEVESALGSPVPNAAPIPCGWISVNCFWWMIGMVSAVSMTACV